MLTTEQQQAVMRMASASVLCETVTGYPAEISLSQCIFESAYLTRCPGNNCFGIKPDHRGIGVVYTVTHEFLNGRWEEMRLAFEKYANIADCFTDHSRLLQQGVYENGWNQYKVDGDIDALFLSLSHHYATDPDYYKNIDAEIHSNTVKQALAAARFSTTT